jgi:hypothetical protein
MKGMIPPFLRDLETMKLQDSVMSNMRDGLKDHLVGMHQSKVVMAKDIYAVWLLIRWLVVGGGWLGFWGLIGGIFYGLGANNLNWTMAMTLSGSITDVKFGLTSWLIMSAL